MNWSNWPIGGQDVVWLLLFSALTIFSPVQTQAALSALVCLGLFQLIQPRVAAFRTDRGVVFSIVIKLLLCYLVLGWTGGINSSYYLLLLLPVVAAATTLSLAGTFLITLLSILSYLSFLLYVDWAQVVLDESSVAELEVRIIFLPVVAFVTYQLAQQNRVEARRSQEVARQLAKANEDLQRAEDAVRRSERLAALGQLTAGLAHELRNPLGTIRASAEMLSRATTDSEVTRELASFICSEADRTNSLVTRFLDFARPVHLKLSPMSMNEVIDEAVLDLANHQPPLDVSFHKNYAPDLPKIPIDGELMERVFYNLMLNAAEASSPGATITLKTRATADTVEAAVIDRGTGIDAAKRESIFNPFFTTKSGGVGLGLAIVAKFVDEHGGQLVVESEPGEGSIFRVLLPYGRT